MLLIKISFIMFLLYLENLYYFLLVGLRGMTGNKRSKLYRHSCNKHHLTSMTKWNTYMSTKTTRSIHTQLASSHKLIIDKHIYYVEILVYIKHYF